MRRSLLGFLLASLIAGLVVLVAPAANATAPKCGTTTPCSRTSMGMAYDPVHNKIVMFGGASDIQGFNRLADTWTWDTTGWHWQSPTTWPCSRHSTRMAWDGTQIMLFGGNGGSDCSTQGSQEDTWLWTGTNWTQCTTL